jgi:AcrR family transcriptional regulator
VAERLQLNHALLYRYVESKEALVELAFRHAMGEELDLTGQVPLPTPPPGHVLKLLRSWFGAHATFPALRAALTRGPGAEDAAAELAGVIDELYGFVEHNRLLLLIESVVIDYPELSEVYVSESKRSHITSLAAFLGSRAASGGLRPAVRSRDRRPLTWCAPAGCATGAAARPGTPRPGSRARQRRRHGRGGRDSRTAYQQRFRPAPGTGRARAAQPHRGGTNRAWLAGAFRGSRPGPAGIRRERGQDATVIASAVRPRPGQSSGDGRRECGARPQTAVAERALLRVEDQAAAGGSPLALGLLARSRACSPTIRRPRPSTSNP